MSPLATEVRTFLTSNLFLLSFFTTEPAGGSTSISAMSECRVQR